MKTTFLLPLISLITVSCDSPKSESSSPSEPTAANETSPNQKVTKSPESESPAISPDSAIEKHIESNFEIAPFQLWTTLHQKHPDYLETHPDLKKKLLTKISNKNIQLTLETVVATPKPDPKIVEQIARTYLATHTPGLWQWLIAKRDELSPELIDAVAAAGAKHCMENKEFGSTYGWLKQMIDPKYEQQLNYKNYQAQLAHKTSLATENPEAFVTKVLAENGPQDDHWLSLGFTAWIDQSAELAQKWYDSQKEELSFPQRDFITISFARAALKKGDIAGSKKIGRRITNPELRAKLKEETPAIKIPFKKTTE